VDRSFKIGMVAVSAVLVAGIGGQRVWSQSPVPTHPATLSDQVATEDRVRKPGWWPTKGSFPASAYVGNATCAQCHADLVSAQQRTSMGQTATRAAGSELLKKYPLSYKLGPYIYQATQSGEVASYSVSDGTKSFATTLDWAFGVRMGQSFLFEKNGGIFMAPLTYYPEAERWDFTVDQPHTVPDSLDKAVGRHLVDSEVRGCFNCHNTGATTSDRFDPEHSTPGVTCEACHGPGRDHGSAVKAGLADQGITMILNPRHLTPVESIDFCGSCHRTWWDVTLTGSTGVTSLRFPPYRLENSRCWGKGDARLTCVACHDPHRPLEREAAAYDPHCLACHVNTPGAKPTADHPGAACPVARKECVSCHMQKSQVVDIPVKFTDHQIRVIRSNDSIAK
jgi:Cytochrome c554 and c-prime